MVGFEGHCLKDLAHTFVECLYEAGKDAVDEKGVKLVIGVDSSSVSVPAHVLDSRLDGKLGDSMVGVTHSRKSGRYRITCPRALEVAMQSQVTDLEAWFAKLSVDEGGTPPNGSGKVAPFLSPIRPTSATGQTQIYNRPLVPEDPAFSAAVRAVAEVARAQLVGHPAWSQKLERYLVEEFGLDPDDMDEWMKIFEKQ
jgi:hypothetical protein